VRGPKEKIIRERKRAGGMSDEERREAWMQTKLTEIEREELNLILDEHKKWMQSEGLKGERAKLDNVNLEGAILGKVDLTSAYLYNVCFKRAELSAANFSNADLFSAHCQRALMGEANLSKANLWYSNFYQANLERANLTEARLGHANLRRANLRLASLKKADLRDADLSDSDLRYADLTDAILLETTPLAGMDLTGTRLPTDIAKFDGLNNVKEAATKASHLFTILLLGCLYSLLTVGTGFMAESQPGKLGLPFIYNAYITREGFSLVAPMVLLGLYCYLHLYLQRLWEHLALLPAIFPDGMPLDKKAHPWVFVGYVRAHIPKLRALPRLPLGRLHIWMVQAVAFWFLPLTLAVFWWRSLADGHWWTTVVDSALTWLGVGLALTFLALAADTLRGQANPDPKASRWQRFKALARLHPYHLAVFGLALEYLVCLSILNWPG